VLGDSGIKDIIFLFIIKWSPKFLVFQLLICIVLIILYFVPNLPV